VTNSSSDNKKTSCEPPAAGRAPTSAIIPAGKIPAEVGRPVVTVDGLAGCGKTTLARMLAQRLGFVHLNSGLLYRAVAYLALENGCSVDDEDCLVKLIGEHSLQLLGDPERGSLITIDGVDCSDRLQTPQISELTSKASRHAKVRAALIMHQREAFPGQGLVAEGRDMGTVVFKDAPLKFFVEVSEEVRVARRLGQYAAKGIDIGAAAAGQELKKNIEIEIRERDKRDQGRAEAPTKPAPDAIFIDNSQQTLTLVLDKMYSLALSKGVATAT
jgi:cytidylate kinase